MKTTIVLIISVLAWSNSNAQAAEAEQLLLNWEKLQTLEEILDNMYTGYKIISKGYTTIKNISEGNYSLHQVFIDGLMAVNPSVRNYRRIPYIIDYQKLLVKEYKGAYMRFKQDPHFTIQEIQYLGNVYNFLFSASLRNVDDLIMIITATKLRMSDEERMRAIDRIYYDMEGKLTFLRGFNNRTQILAIQRAKAANDVRVLNHIYGLD